jgi:ketosteroid isomerase-like protein
VSEENVGALRRGLEAFNRTGEIDTSFLAEDFEVHQASSIIDTDGVFHGRDALRQSWSELAEVFDDLRLEPERIIEAPGGEIVVLLRACGTGRGSGLVMDNHIGWVCTFRDDEAVRLVVYEEPAEALEAVGLSE